MKYTTLIAAVALLATACQKKKCWQCTETVKVTYTDPTTGVEQLSEVAETTPVCDMTKKEKTSYEKTNSGRTTQQVGALSVRAVMTTNCN